MRLLTWITALTLGLSLVCVCTPSITAQDLDAAKADAAHHKVEFENDQVRVLRYEIPAGDKTAKHSHPNCVNILLTDAKGKFTTADGKTTEVQGKAGTAAFRAATTHVAENIGDKRIEGILVELKKPSSALPAGAADEVAVDPTHAKLEFENEQVRVLRYHFNPGDKSTLHGHPDNVQVLLTDSIASVTTPDGKTAAVSGKAGEVRWRPAGQHVVQNMGDKPFEGILVEMKGAAGAKAAGK